MSATPHARSRWVGTAIAILMVLAQLAGPAAQAQTVAEQLLVSLRADRQNPVPLEGASLAGDAYIFVRVPDPAKVVRVAFIVDGDRDLRSTDSAAPFDLAGTAANRNALPFDVSTLGPGQHQVEANVRYANRRVTIRSTFTVPSTTAPPPAGPTPTPTPTPTPPPPTAVRLGLHVTADELSTWRNRAANGPYRVQGDESANSPGDWNRITSYKDRFLANPTASLWGGPTANNAGGCVTGAAGGSPADDLRYVPPVMPPAELRDAAFYAMVAPGAADAARTAAAVRDQLLAQINRGDTRFGDRARWCLNGATTGDQNPMFNIANWLTKLVYAYDYLTVYEREQGTTLFTDAQRTALRSWLGAAASWMADGVDEKLDPLFVDRRAGNYALTALGSSTSSGDRITYYGGPVARVVHRRYNNRAARSARLVTLVGILNGDEAFRAHGRRFVQESLMFGYFPQGAVSDFERWTVDDPTKGWKYGNEFAGALLTMADALARAGDPSLYRFTTTGGALGSQGTHRSGAPKSLATLAADMMSYVDGSTVRYGTDQGARNGVAGYRIDSINDLAGEQLMNDVQSSTGNRWYRDAYVRSVYTRRAAGAPGYPVNPRDGQGDVQGGEAGTYPGVLFMFGNLEEGLSPYPPS